MTPEQTEEQRLLSPNGIAGLDEHLKSGNFYEPSGKLSESLKRFEIDIHEEISDKVRCIGVNQEGKNYAWGTFGEFSVITGKAKSKKTFLIGIPVAAAMKGGTIGNLTAAFPANKKNILYFDTEQSKAHAQKSIKRIYQLAGKDNADNFRAYFLRQLSPKERREHIEFAIYNTENLGLVIIDGIRDLIIDINSPAESTDLASYLMKWTSEKDIHIITIIHQNKESNHARGHIGTELMNKAETVISVATDASDISRAIVKVDASRDMPFDDFAFRITEDGLPELDEDWTGLIEKQGAGGRMDRQATPSEIAKETHDAILKEVYAQDTHPTYKQLWTRIKASVKGYSRCSDGRAKELAAYYQRENMISKIEGIKKYPVYQFNKLSV